MEVILEKETLREFYRIAFFAAINKLKYKLDL